MYNFFLFFGTFHLLSLDISNFTTKILENRFCENIKTPIVHLIININRLKNEEKVNKKWFLLW